MGAVPLSVPAARSGGPPTDTGPALRAASAAESGTGLGQRAASAAEAGRAADLTVWASSLRPRTPSGSSSASTWRSRECWTCSPRVRLRLSALRGRCGRLPLLSGCPAPHGAVAAVPRAALPLSVGFPRLAHRFLSSVRRGGRQKNSPGKVGAAWPGGGGGGARRGGSGRGPWSVSGVRTGRSRTPGCGAGLEARGEQ